MEGLHVFGSTSLLSRESSRSLHLVPSLPSSVSRSHCRPCDFFQITSSMPSSSHTGSLLTLTRSEFLASCRSAKSMSNGLPPLAKSGKTVVSRCISNKAWLNEISPAGGGDVKLNDSPPPSCATGSRRLAGRSLLFRLVCRLNCLFLFRDVHLPGHGQHVLHVTFHACVPFVEVEQ